MILQNARKVETGLAVLAVNAGVAAISQISLTGIPVRPFVRAEQERKAYELAFENVGGAGLMGAAQLCVLFQARQNRSRSASETSCAPAGQGRSSITHTASAVIPDFVLNGDPAPP